MNQKLELFESLFSKYPNIAILHIDNSLNLVNETLEKIAKENSSKVKYIKFVDEKSAKLKAVAREYEYVVLSNILSFIKDKKTILKLMYKALENSGNLIIIEKKSDKNEELLQLLEELDFQAPNNISLFDDYDLITAKKMHHWGSGL